MVKIIHYREQCIGCNVCVEHAPDYWEISAEDGKANLKQAKKKKEVYIREMPIFDKEKNEAAAKACPVSIIKVMV